MKTSIEHKKDEVDDGVIAELYEITIIPESEEEKEYLREWDFHIEKFFDDDGNLILLI